MCFKWLLATVLLQLGGLFEYFPKSHAGTDLTSRWPIVFQGKSLARSFYHQEDIRVQEERKPYIGKEFSSASYFNQSSKDREFLKSLQDLDEISISNNSSKSELRMTGGESGVRLFVLDPIASIAKRFYLYIGTTPLSSQMKMVANGCIEYSGVSERVAFKKSNFLLFYDQTVFVRYQAPSGNFSDCAPYLNQILEEIRSGMASSFWMAAYETNGIDLDKIEDLVELDIHFFFQPMNAKVRRD